MDSTDASVSRIAQRTFNACDACKHSRRKCNGAEVCDGCARRGIECLYTQNRKRGRPKAAKLLSHDDDVGTSDETDVPAAPKLPLLARIRRIEARSGLNLTSDERSMLKTVFSFTNRIFAAVDEANFYAVAQEELGPKHPLQALSRRAAPPPPPCPLAFRACCAMLLSIGSRLRGQHGLAKGYLAEARQAVGAALASEQPSQLLVSSLLLFTMTTSAGFEVDGEASRHADMAHSLLRFVPELRTDIRFGVCGLRSLHSSVSAWPPPSSTIGMDPLSRFLEIQPFVIAQLTRDFRDVKAENVPAYIALADECISLYPSMGEYAADFPLIPLNIALKAIISHRTGDIVKAADFAASAFTSASGLSRVSAAFMPLAFAMGHLLPVAVDIVRNAIHGKAASAPLSGKAEALVDAAVRLLSINPDDGPTTDPRAQAFQMLRRELTARVNIGAVHLPEGLSLLKLASAQLSPAFASATATSHSPLSSDASSVSAASRFRSDSPLPATLPAFWKMGASGLPPSVPGGPAVGSSEGAWAINRDELIRALQALAVSEAAGADTGASLVEEHHGPAFAAPAPPPPLDILARHRVMMDSLIGTALGLYSGKDLGDAPHGVGLSTESTDDDAAVRPGTRRAHATAAVRGEQAAAAAAAAFPAADSFRGAPPYHGVRPGDPELRSYQASMSGIVSGVIPGLDPPSAEAVERERRGHVDLPSEWQEPELWDETTASFPHGFSATGSFAHREALSAFGRPEAAEAGREVHARPLSSAMPQRGGDAESSEWESLLDEEGDNDCDLTSTTSHVGWGV